MRTITTVLLSLFLLDTGAYLTAQQTKGLKPVIAKQKKALGVSRALVVGISDYQNPDITDLQYAHADAEIFADYLTSTSGMGLEKEHVTLLINEEATSGNFVSALYGLIEDSQEGDRVVLYFSGHGDVETTTMMQPGFLLCWDAPATVYMAGGTFPLSYLQDIVSTLSVQKKVEVIVITDACRAGKLAGSSVGGTSATASALAQQYANETKLLSCQPNELALEGKDWGDGRGVFSYYLMAGLHGLADLDDDGHVTLKEIGRYLEDEVAESVAPHEQTPIVVGDKKTILADIDPAIATQLKSEGIDKTLGTIQMRGTTISVETFRDSTDYVIYQAYLQAMDNGHYLHPEQGSAYKHYLKLTDVDALSPYINLIKRNLAAALQDEAQQAINDYLAASPQELKARWTNDEKYQRFPKSLRIAADLLGPDHFFYNTLMARSLYFEGLCLRIESDWMGKNDSLFQQAISIQKKSLKIDSLAPHTLNEMGILYGLSGEHEQALQYHKEAVALSPTWILGQSNIGATYIDMGDYNTAIGVCETVLAMDSTFLFNLNNLAKARYETGDKVSPIALLKHAINLDSTYNSKAHWLLAEIYSNEGNLTEALNQYKKAEKLKPNNPELKIDIAHVRLQLGDTLGAKKYFELAHHVAPQNVKAIQGLIEFDYHTGDLRSAKTKLIKYLEDDPSDEFAHFILASIYAEEGNVVDCVTSLKKATKSNTLDLDSMIRDTPYFDKVIDHVDLINFLNTLGK